MPLKLSGIPLKQPASATPELPPILTEAQAAEYLAIPEAKLRRIRYAGRGPRSLKIGNMHRYRREDLLLWMEQVEA